MSQCKLDTLWHKHKQHTQPTNSNNPPTHPPTDSLTRAEGRVLVALVSLRASSFSTLIFLTNKIERIRSSSRLLFQFAVVIWTFSFHFLFWNLTKAVELLGCLFPTLLLSLSPLTPAVPLLISFPPILVLPNSATNKKPRNSQLRSKRQLFFPIEQRKLTAA